MSSKTLPIYPSLGSLLALLLVLLSGCRKELPITDLPRQQRLTMNYLTSTGLSKAPTGGTITFTPSRLQLSRTGQGEPSYLKQARIVIEVNGAVSYDQTPRLSRGTTAPDVAFAPGDQVRITATDLTTQEVITSTLQVPAQPLPFTVSVTKVPTKRKYLQGNPQAYDLRWTIEMTDPVGEENYYRLELRRFDVQGWSSSGGSSPFSPSRLQAVPDNDLILQDGEVTAESDDEDLLGDLVGRPATNKTLVFSDRLIQGGRATLSVRTDAQSLEPFYSLASRSYILVVLQAISRETYLFLKQMNTLASNSYDEENFLATPIQFPSNTSTGVGLVSIASERTFTVSTLPN